MAALRRVGGGTPWTAGPRSVSTRLTPRAARGSVQDMIALIIILLVVWAILAILGFAIKGLLWLAILGIVFFVITLIVGWLRRGASRS